VASHKKKIVAFLVVAVVGSVALRICTAGSATTEQKKPSPKNSCSLFAKDPNLLTKAAHSPDIGALFLRTMLAVLLVAVLGAAVIYVSKRFLPRITNLAGKKIHVIETIHLGPRKAVHLLKIGNRQLLIGSSSENITMLADITDISSETDLSATQIDNNREYK
jgi:flagellar biosynthetic protein FliO